MSKYLLSTKEAINKLKTENVKTWFDLGLLLDRIKEENSIKRRCCIIHQLFKRKKYHGGIGFLTFQYSIDGVSIEVKKYSKIIRQLYNNCDQHFICGKFFPEGEQLFINEKNKFSNPAFMGFDDWKLYKDFFFNKIERGSEKYNSLIKDFWDETLSIVKILGEYLEKNEIYLIYTINVNSNPGNVSLALALVLLSELMGISIISNNHDFYWEGGKRKIEREQNNESPGPRDFFFNNAHVGEFFSIIEMIYPWTSKNWINVNINQQQTEHLITKNGHNPSSVIEIGTAVDINEYRNVTKREKLSTFFQFEKVLSRYKDTLISYSSEDVIKNSLVDESNPKPILIGARKTKPLNHFLNENIIFLQPTRIIERKRIELGFYLINKLFNDKEFFRKFLETPHLKLTLLVTGPIATGHYEYFKELLNDFNDLLKSLDSKVRNKVYLALLFSELDTDKFKRKFENPVGIPALYNIASLILLPSETEGRGLPIIEAAACGVPIFCSRYYPENVYSEVIGEHLPEQDRLRVIEFDGKVIDNHHVEEIKDKVFYPHLHSYEMEHNARVVNKRYSLQSLSKNLEDIFSRLYIQQKLNIKDRKIAEKALKKYEKIALTQTNKDLQSILLTKNREYLPGFNRLHFMIYLKSLIDPSFFRIEEMEVKGVIFNYARKLINNIENRDTTRQVRYYDIVAQIFNIMDGEVSIRHDHSLPYRHRNNYKYSYQQFTLQELTGVVNYVFHRIFHPDPIEKVDKEAHFFTDWNLALTQLTSSSNLAIDDRDILIRKLKSNVPIAYFPGKYVKNELEFFALQSVRSRLEMDILEELTEELIQKTVAYIAPIFVFVVRKFNTDKYDLRSIRDFIIHGDDKELKLLYDYGIVRIVESEQWCQGIHFPQMGDEALKILHKVKDEKGFMITSRDYSAIMTDIVDLDRFHIGRIDSDLMANIMGIPINSGFIQFVPKSLRTTLTYPTPVQRAIDFHNFLRSDKYIKLSKKYGESTLFEKLRKNAIEDMSPLKEVIKKLEGITLEGKTYHSQSLTGKYEDGMPWNGAIAEVQLKGDKKWYFTLVSTVKPQKVTDFIADFEEDTGYKARVAWNGGYILNAELVGKLGLPENYIGSPLGLLVVEGKLIAPPLFNKPAMVIDKEGNVDIIRVNCSQGIIVSRGTSQLSFDSKMYNSSSDDLPMAYYDLMYEKDEIFANGRVVIRLAGSKIHEVIKTKKGEKIPVLPVGITLVLTKSKFDNQLFVKGNDLNIKVVGYEHMMHAVEAGPMLLENGEIAIDMKKEGWLTNNSIKTQAARLDYTDMRGPKIAMGIDKKGKMVVLTVNGRIRESVGATHYDMAEILKKLKMVKAMGFDPGGSSTLVVDDKPVNISPYNQEYETNIYSLPPQPRAVSNAVISYFK